VGKVNQLAAIFETLNDKPIQRQDLNVASLTLEAAEELGARACAQGRRSGERAGESSHTNTMIHEIQTFRNQPRQQSRAFTHSALTSYDHYVRANTPPRFRITTEARIMAIPAASSFQVLGEDPFHSPVIAPIVFELRTEAAI